MICSELGGLPAYYGLIAKGFIPYVFIYLEHGMKLIFTQDEFSQVYISGI